MLGRKFGGGIGANQGFKAGFDVGHAAAGGQQGEFGVWFDAESGFGLDQRGHAVRDVRVDDEQAHGAGVVP